MNSINTHTTDPTSPPGPDRPALSIERGARIWVPAFRLGARVTQAGDTADRHLRVLWWDALPGYGHSTGITTLPPGTPVRLVRADAGPLRPAPEPLTQVPAPLPPGRDADPGHRRPRSVAWRRRAG